MSPEALRLLRFGTAAPAPEPVALAAGPLTAELVAGQLRAIRWHGIEVLRAVAYVVRDRDWGTHPLAVRDLVLRADPEGFDVSYRARCTGAGGAALDIAAAIAGRRDGALSFTVTAEPDRDFETNRCGFCVLHPIVGVAGTPVTVEHVDGRESRAVWPDAIAPWQPFRDIRALAHAVAPGVTATCRMEGDVFEMEDQRNWSDASYKTYVRPIGLPWPHVLPARAAFRQSVTLTIAGAGPARRAAPAGDVIAVTLGGPVGAMPRFGLAITPEEAGAVLARRAALDAVAPQLLLLHFDPTAGHAAGDLARLAAVRRLRPGAEAVLECVVPGREAPRVELDRIAALVREAGLSLDTVAVCPAVDRQSTPPGSTWPECPQLEEVYRAARAAFPGLALCGGMFSYFTELNRKRPPVALLDIVSHCTCPTVHAADDLSVMQSLEALPFILRSARAIAGDRRYRIGPSTIGMRQNPYGSRTVDNPDGARLTMTHADPRQRGLFAAAWMVGYAAASEAAGLDALTGAALTGTFGLVAAAGGGVWPAFHAARALAALAGAPRLACRSDRPDHVLALAATRDGRRHLCVANITDAPRDVAVPAGFAAAAVLDQDSWADAAHGTPPPPRPLAPGVPLRLAPYAIATLEG